MARVTRPRRNDRAERREEITAALLEHTERLLEQESWTSLTVERICTASGIARSTFYMFFEDQSHLLTVLADRALRLVKEAGEGWWTLPPGAAREDLFTAVDAILTSYTEHGAILTAVIEAASYSDAVRDQFDETKERAYAAMTEHIVRGQADGWIHSSLEADHIAHWLSWMGEGGLAWALQRQKRLSRRMVQAYVDAIWNVLYADAP